MMKGEEKKQDRGLRPLLRRPLHGADFQMAEEPKEPTKEAGLFEVGSWAWISSE